MTNQFKFLMLTAIFFFSASSFAAEGLKVKRQDEANIEVGNKVGKSSFSFVVSSPIETIRGTANKVSGSFKINPADLSSISGKIEVLVKSMETGHPTRDRHLKGRDWLKSKKYPAIVYTIEKAENIKIDGSKANLDVLGVFSMKGKDLKDFRIPVTIKWIDGNEATAKKAPGDLVKIDTKFKLSLDQYKMRGRRGSVGKRVGKVVELSGTLYGNSTN